MTLKEYIAELNNQYQTGIAREHTYRPALQQLLSGMLPHLIVSNDPARLQCGAPDFLLMRKTGNTPVAFMEVKDTVHDVLRGIDSDNQAGEVWINETQYFENVPFDVWNFYIGGYQPARKWLKDRIERTLTFDEIEHYQRIIVALKKTIEIMKEIVI